MTDCVLIITTAPTQDEARRIAAALVDRHLAACVQLIGPIESIYRWQGQVETAAEWQCWIKTTATHYAAVEQTIRHMHSYDVPEILALPVAAGHSAYLTWLRQSVQLGPSV